MVNLADLADRLNKSARNQGQHLQIPNPTKSFNEHINKHLWSLLSAVFLATFVDLTAQPVGLRSMQTPERLMRAMFLQRPNFLAAIITGVG